LPEKYKEIGLNWLESKNPFYVMYVCELTNLDSNYFFKSFQNPEIIKSMHPRMWWKNACKSSVDDGFKELVDNLLTFQASTGGIERSFSTLGSIMTKQRNRLGIEKAAKLCSIVNHFKLQVV
jgi:hypothetical protein